MNDAFHTLGGTAAFCLVHAALWAGASRAAAAWPGRFQVQDRVLLAIALAAIQTVALTLATAAFEVMTRWVLGGASLAVSAGVMFAARGPARGGDPVQTRTGGTGLGVLASLGRLRSEEPLFWLVILPGLAFHALLFAYALPRPPMGYDPLNYHLTIAATAIQSHHFPIVFFPPYFHLYAWFPANGGVFSIWAMIFNGCDLWLPLVNLPFLIGLAIALYGIARETGAERLAAAAATSALLTVPMIGMLATEAYVEIPLWAMFFIAMRFAVISARPDAPPRLFLLVAGLIGLMAGTKTTGVFLGAVVFLSHAAWTFAPRAAWARATLRDAGLAALGVLGLGSYFYLRNFWLSGNPLYPVPVHLLGVTVFPGVDDLASRLSGTTILAHWDHLWDSGKLVRALLGEVFTPNSSWGLGPTGLAVLLAVPLIGIVVALRRPRSGIPRAAVIWFAAGLAVLLGWLAMPYGGKFLFANVRFAYPAVVLWTFVTLTALARVPQLPVAMGFLAVQVASFFFTNVPVSAGVGLAAAVLGAAAVFGGSVVVPLARDGRIRTDRPWVGPWWRRVATATAAGLVLAFLLVQWHDAVHRNRIRSYREADEPYHLQVAEYADCLDAVERDLPRGRLAVALEPLRRGFLYPLFGAHLQREVLYVHNGPEDSRLHCDYPGGNPRLRPDREAWLRHLAEARPGALLAFVDPVEHEIPVEVEWAESMPARFRKTFQSDRCVLFLIDSADRVQ